MNRQIVFHRPHWSPDGNCLVGTYAHSKVISTRVVSTIVHLSVGAGVCVSRLLQRNVALSDLLRRPYEAHHRRSMLLRLRSCSQTDSVFSAFVRQSSLRLARETMTRASSSACVQWVRPCHCAASAHGVDIERQGVWTASSQYGRPHPPSLVSFYDTFSSNLCSTSHGALVSYRYYCL